MAKLKLPFELEKPSSNEYVTQTSQIGHNGQPLDQALGDLSKLDNISKQSTQSEEEAIRFETDGGTLVGKVDSTGADFTNLKRGGQQVARMSDLPTKDSSIGENPSTTNVPTTKAVKDYVDTHGGGGGNPHISDETTQSMEQEIIFGNDNKTQEYAKIGEYGLKAVGFYDMSGNPITQNNAALTGGLFFEEGDKFLLTGASFATANATDTGWAAEINGYNRWFEDACGKLGVIPINHAIGGQSINNTASMMKDADASKPHGSLFMENGVDIFDDVSVFIIMQVHNQNVYYTGSKTLSDYLSGSVNGYAEAFDYTIKQYEKWCADSGKYCQILLCTHWHDARVTFNTAIRKLSKKWGLPLCEFDTKVGFSKNTPLDSGKQISVLYSWDSNGQSAGSVETINGVVYGWHMKKPTYTTVDNYQLSPIQKRMSKIFQSCFTK